MLAFSLYADLQRRGVELFLAKDSKLGFRAPVGALDDVTKSLMREHKDHLAQLVYEIEEHKARVLAHYPEGASIPLSEYEEAERLAHEAVRGASASPDGLLYLRAYAMQHPTVRAYFEAFGPVAGEIVSVERIAV